MSRPARRTALVTGANRGIGLAVAAGLVSLGDRVIAACRSIADAERTVAALDPSARQALPLALDLGSSRSIGEALHRLAADRLEVDVLVNNAGVYPAGTILTADPQAFHDAMDVHFFGPLALCRTLVPGMIERGYGRVVNVTSGYGCFSEGLGGSAPYALTKAALNALTFKLATEVRGDVKVNAACPGWVRTRMGGPHAARSPEEGADTPLWLADLPAEGPNGGVFRDRRRIDW